MGEYSVLLHKVCVILYIIMLVIQSFFELFSQGFNCSEQVGIFPHVFHTIFVYYVFGSLAPWMVLQFASLICFIQYQIARSLLHSKPVLSYHTPDIMWCGEAIQFPSTCFCAGVLSKSSCTFSYLRDLVFVSTYLWWSSLLYCLYNFI